MKAISAAEYHSRDPDPDLTAQTNRPTQRSLPLHEADTTSGSPYPDEIPNTGRGELNTPSTANTDPPSPGNDLAAIDYRADPSARQADHPYTPNDRDHPFTAGIVTGPPPDKTIQSYDLPDQLSSYDHMGER